MIIKRIKSAMIVWLPVGARLEGSEWQENDSRLAPTGETDLSLTILNFKLNKGG